MSRSMFGSPPEDREHAARRFALLFADLLRSIQRGGGSSESSKRHAEEMLLLIEGEVRREGAAPVHDDDPACPST